MRLRLLALCLISWFAQPAFAQKYLEMITAGTYPLSEIQKEAEAYFDVVGRDRGYGYKPYKRWEYVAQMELDQTGVKIPNVELSQRGLNYRQAEKLNRSELNGFSGEWKQLGPTTWNATSSWSPGLGRVTTLGIEEANPNHILVGSPTGGVWKTLNAGSTWTPIADEFSTIDVYALEISPYNNSFYIWGSNSGRIYRSLDGGATWTNTSNLTGNGKVNRILFHPSDPNLIYAVSESNGLFRSTNQGANWTAVTGASGFAGYDVEFKPDDPNTIYFSGISVYRSTNGGTSFNQITGFGTANNNYKRLGVSPANPNMVYVLEASGGKFGGFYRSTNTGMSFDKLISGDTINYLGYSEIGDDDKGQAPRNMDIAVHPFNANEVHIGGIHTWKSTDAGVSFELTSYWVPSTAAALGVGYNHADIDVLRFVGNTLHVGTDGGYFISIDGAASFIDRSSGLGIREFYKMGVSRTDPNVVSGGSQDNGTSVMRGANRAWVDWLGADGMESFVDWSNASILYGTSQYGSMYRSTNQGNSRSSISKPLDVGDGAWVTPFEQDPQVATTIYVAFADVWKSTNSGTDWVKISNFDNGNFTQMKLAPSDNQRIYIAKGANLFTTANGGTSWTTTAVGWGTSTINYIAVHPQNPQRVLVVTSGTVYHSLDAGATWTNIGASLPSGTKYCATWEEGPLNGIYVGGFGFISYTNDELGGAWSGFFDGLPNARVYELEINYLSNTIFACTYGRGLWESQLYKALAPVSVFQSSDDGGCGKVTVTFTDKSLYSPNAWEWTFEGGTPATSNVQNPTVIFSGTGSHVVRLKSTNSIGTSAVEATDTIVIFGPTPPMVADVSRCDAGEIVLEAAAMPGLEIEWFASDTSDTPLFAGESYTVNLNQTSTFYAGTLSEVISTQRVGPLSKNIGTGNDHAGGRYLILNAETPFLLKTATVFATGAANRTFQLLDANGAVLRTKTVFINDGEQRITLNMDIPQGTNLQLGCINPANLFRNSSGVTFPYTVPDVMTITGSTGGADYYYYLYDIEVETAVVCPSDRVPVTAVVNTAPAATSISLAGAATLCPSDSALISVAGVCADCAVHWSNGQTGASIKVSEAGIFSATLGNVCGDGPASNTIEIFAETVPVLPSITTTGSATICPGASVVLSVENSCAGCTFLWSTGETGSSISIDTAGVFAVRLGNICGESPLSNPIQTTVEVLPSLPEITVSGATTLCPGETVTLSVENPCPGCEIQWSNGATGASVSLSEAGNFTASAVNLCGETPANDTVQTLLLSLPYAPTIAATGSTTLCLGESVVLQAESLCPDCEIEWSTGETGPSISVSNEGQYAARLRNACGESQVSNILTINVLSVPSAPAIEALGSTSLCNADTVELRVAQICPDCSVLWSNGETGPSITVNALGNFTATLQNACGASPVSNLITVLHDFVPNTPVISASNSLVCFGESVQLSVLNDVCQGCTVIWSNGSTGMSTTVTSSGIYTAVVDASSLCGLSLPSNAVSIEVAPPFVPTVQLSNLCQLTAPFGSDYQWFVDGAPIANATGQTWSAVVAGNYEVHMTGLDGCLGISAPVFAEACISGAQEATGDLGSARVYPNPAKDRVFLDLQLEAASSLRFELFAADGRFLGVLLQQELSSGKQILELNLPELPAGVYPFRLVSDRGQLNGNLKVE